MRGLRFRGDSLDQLRGFPPEPRREIGYNLQRVQCGDLPHDWKAMPDVGKGVREIRIKDDGNAYRAIYTAKFDGVVYVLFCFEKKSAKTPKRVVDAVRSRLRELKKELGK